MGRRVFFSFHYEPDSWRASQVRNIGAIEGSASVSDNDWEQVKRGGDGAIQRWIDGQLSGRSCTVVLIGAGTAGRKWINYEIQSSWAAGKGLVGVYIHRLKNREQLQSPAGANPFATFSVGQVNLAQIAESYDPPYSDSQQAYGYIRDNLENWVERAIQIRAQY